jgi:hypothetical protein
LKLGELIDLLDATYSVQLDRGVWTNALANADEERVTTAVSWWIENGADREPTVADLRWVARTQLDRETFDGGLAAARAALHGQKVG